MEPHPATTQKNVDHAPGHRLSGLMRANRRVAGNPCALCQVPFTLGEDMRNCPGCGAMLHLACWNKFGGCVSRTCAYSFPAASAVPALTSTTSDSLVPHDVVRCTCGRVSDGTSRFCTVCGQPLLPGIQPVGQPVRTFSDLQGERIGFGLRFGAALMDVGFCIIVWVVVTMAFAGSATHLFAAAGTDQSTAAAGGLAIGWIASYIAAILYNCIEGFIGRSPGKALLGLYITYADGRPGDVGLWFRRSFFKNLLVQLLGFAAGLFGAPACSYIAGVYTIILGVGGFMVFGGNKQALHDAIVGSAVYRRQP